jgi:hypothetical protein
MRFWRSLTSKNTPEAVVAEAAAAGGGKRALADLYKVWLKAGGDWGNTSYAQTKRHVTSDSSKGCFKLLSEEEIIGRYGETKGKELMKRKLTTGEVEDHPDFPGEKLFKCFDAKTYESLSRNEQESAMTFSAALDAHGAAHLAADMQHAESQPSASAAGAPGGDAGKGKGKGGKGKKDGNEPPQKKVKTDDELLQVRLRGRIRALNDWIVQAGAQMTMIDASPMDKTFGESLKAGLQKHVGEFQTHLASAVSLAQGAWDARAATALLAETDAAHSGYAASLDLAKRASKPPKAKAKAKART